MPLAEHPVIVQICERLSALDDRIEKLENDSHPPIPIMDPARVEQVVAQLHGQLLALQARVDALDGRSSVCHHPNVEVVPTDAGAFVRCSYCFTILKKK